MKKICSLLYIAFGLSLLSLACPDGLYDSGDFKKGDFPVCEIEISASFPTYIPKEKDNATLEDESLYSVIEEGLRDFDKKINISSFKCTQKEVSDTFYEVLWKNYDLYYVTVSPRLYMNLLSGKITELVPEYSTTDAEEISETTELLEDKFDEILSCTSEEMTDIEKLLVIQDKINLCTEYNNDLNAQSYYSAKHALLDGKTICQGYASSFFAIAARAGITGGFVSNENHVWNAFLIDDKWYHADATWDDTGAFSRIYHKHFLKSDEWMSSETDRKAFTPIGADDTCYDNAFWTEITGPVVIDDGNYYFVDGKEAMGSILMYNPSTEATEIVYEFTNYWSADESSYWGGTFSGLGFFDNRLYFNTDTKIMSCSLGGKNYRTEYCIDDEAAYSIYGCYVENNNLYYAVAKKKDLNYPSRYNKCALELEAYAWKTGDITGNDEIDMNDAIYLLQYSMFPTLYPLDYAGNVDFNNDGEIDMNDAILLLQHSMFPELYPIE